MIDEIRIFLLVLSVLFLLRNLFVLVINLISENIKPLEISNTNHVLLYLTLAYIITWIII